MSLPCSECDVRICPMRASEHSARRYRNDRKRGARHDHQSRRGLRGGRCPARQEPVPAESAVAYRAADQGNTRPAENSRRWDLGQHGWSERREEGEGNRLASGASYEVDHLDWLLSNITRLRNRLRIVDKKIGRAHV